MVLMWGYLSYSNQGHTLVMVAINSLAMLFLYAPLGRWLLAMGDLVVPWQTIDKSGQALQQADQLGLFIFDRRPTGNSAIRHSARLKAYRDAEQLIEYLLLVQQRQHWSSSQMQAFIEVGDGDAV